MKELIERYFSSPHRNTVNFLYTCVSYYLCIVIKTHSRSSVAFVVHGKWSRKFLEKRCRRLRTNFAPLSSHVRREIQTIVRDPEIRLPQNFQMPQPAYNRLMKKKCAKSNFRNLSFRPQNSQFWESTNERRGGGGGSVALGREDSPNWFADCGSSKIVAEKAPTNTNPGPWGGTFCHLQLWTFLCEKGKWSGPACKIVRVPFWGSGGGLGPWFRKWALCPSWTVISSGQSKSNFCQLNSSLKFSLMERLQVYHLVQSSMDIWAVDTSRTKIWTSVTSTRTTRSSAACTVHGTTLVLDALEWNFQHQWRENEKKTPDFISHEEKERFRKSLPFLWIQILDQNVRMLQAFCSNMPEERNFLCSETSSWLAGVLLKQQFLRE